MTNSFMVAIAVMWATNQMDTLLTPAGDEMIRSMITSQVHVYTIPGQETVTNTVAVYTNSVHRKMQWLELPPVPVLTSNSTPVKIQDRKIALSNLVYQAEKLRAMADEPLQKPK